MSYKTYTSEFKAKVVIEVFQGEKSLSEIAAQYNLNPNILGVCVEHEHTVIAFSHKRPRIRGVLGAFP